MSPFRRVWNTIRRRQLDDEIRQEVDTHLALIEDEERANGASDGRRPPACPDTLWQRPRASRTGARRCDGDLSRKRVERDRVRAAPAASESGLYGRRRSDARAGHRRERGDLRRRRARAAQSAALSGVRSADRRDSHRHASQSGADHGHHARLLFSVPRARAHTRRHRAVRHDRRDVDRQRRPAAHQGDPRDDVVRQRHAGVAGSGALVY